MYLGIDLGTTDVKVILLAEDGVLGIEREPLSISRPHPGYSEQSPEAWWQATCAAVARLRAKHTAAWPRIEGIGLSGQMHGAVVLDATLQVLRPAILWNDVRAADECADLMREHPEVMRVSGNLAMPGFTAPKLMWMKRHEPTLFSRIAKVLLPKDYLRLQLTGRCVSDMSDASGTLWLDVQQRAWSPDLLKATGMDEEQMPDLVEGSASTGTILPELAQAWGLSPDVLVAGGAGDNAASALGIGAIDAGDGFISLGTSGVVFVVTDRFRPNTAGAIHAFCHAIPQRWHQMAVMLSAGASLSWLAKITQTSEAKLLDAIDLAKVIDRAPLFLPYLGGERTPHNNADVRAAFHGIDHDTDVAALTYAVMEGVAFGLKDGLSALNDAGTRPTYFSFVGGGARSSHWVQLHADILGIELGVITDAAHGAALGAARLARIATGIAPENACAAALPHRVFSPTSRNQDQLASRYGRWRALYRATN